MEIAGSTCTICGQRVVLTREGKGCSACGIVVHQACHAQSKCGRCGREYEIPEPPFVDVARDAIVPRSLRPGRSASPVAAVVLAALLLLFGMAFLIYLLYPHR